MSSFKNYEKPTVTRLKKKDDRQRLKSSKLFSLLRQTNKNSLVFSQKYLSVSINNCLSKISERYYLNIIK